MRPPFPPDPESRLQAEMAALRDTLERLACGTPLARFLEELCLSLEQLLSEGRCSILRLDREGIRVQHGAGPSLSREYMALIDGAPIGPQAGSCGTAMYRRQPVVVEDIATDPLWETYRAAALPFGLKACASIPILDPVGNPLGAFAIYHLEPGPFPAADLAVLHRFTDIASLAIRIHEREERLHAEELRHRALVEQSGDCIFYFDADSGQLLEGNQAFQDLFGYTREEIPRLQLSSLVAHDAASIRFHIQATRTHRTHQLGERNYRRKDGSLIPVEVSATALNLGDRTIFSVIARDIRARIQTQEALKASEAKLREAQRLGRLGHWSFDLATQQITWSDTIFEIFDRDPAFGPPSFPDYVASLHPEDREDHLARINRALQGEANAGFDLRTLARDGQVRWHRGQVHPLWAEGRVTGLYGVAQDITEQKETEARLKTYAESLKAVMDQASDGIFVAGSDTRYLDANPRALEMVGYSLEELRTLSVQDLVPPEEKHEVPERVKLLDLGRPYLVERTLLRKDGTTFRAEISARRLEDGRFLSICRDVTERHQAEARLRQAAQELDEAQALGRIGSWTLELATGEVRWSPTMYRITERDPERGPLDPEEGERFFDPEGTGAYRTQFDRLTREGGEAEADTLARLPDGRTRTFHSIIRADSEQGHVVRLRGVLQDVTDARKAQRDLAYSESRFRIIAEQTGQLVYDMDVPTRHTVWDGAIEALTGYGREEFQSTEGDIWSQLVHPEDLEAALAELNRCIEALRPYHTTYRFRRKDGTYFPVEDRGIFLPGPDGKALRMLGTMTDISEQEAARARQARTEQSFRHLFDLNPAPMVLSRPSDGTILLANEAAYRMFRLTPAEVESKRTVDFFAHPEDRQRLLAALAEQGRVQDFDLEMVVHGERRKVLLSAGIPDYLGERAILVALTDITDRAREQETQRQSQKLESLGLLAGGIAHDFNNLLTSLLGNLGLAQLHLPPDSPSTPYLSDMEAVIQRAADLARQMLAYSGKGRFRQEPVDLNHLVREMTHLLSVGIPKRIQLNLDLDPALPRVQGDPVQLQQVVMNLVTNASEAIGDRNGSIRIRTERRRLDAATRARLAPGQNLAVGEYLCLEVEDSGAGMAPEVLARIFDPFFTTKATGRGLGLSALLGILTGHKAGLTLDSTPGVGTRFTIWFSPLPEGVDPATPPAPAIPTASYQGCALVVDDEAPVRASAGALLTHLGFKVEEAEDGLVALDRLAALGGACEVVILDLTMPRMDGHETLLHIRERWPQLPVILSSGYSEQADRMNLGGPGAILPKPYRVADLRAALAKALAKPT
jgi:two-component system cell cycle sensor histidine kinase/response regulator CckA